MSNVSEFKPLILCPDCKVEMRLFGTEAENEVRDVYSFECIRCGRIDARGVLVAAPYRWN
jgi:hypothetical protein